MSEWGELFRGSWGFIGWIFRCDIKWSVQARVSIYLSIYMV